jgi:predicted RNA-binding Zn ribbon-like protein
MRLPENLRLTQVRAWRDDMLDPGAYSGTYEPAAGRLCLDFANTLSWRNSDRQHDWLDSYSNLVEWGALVGILPVETVHRLHREAARDPTKAGTVLKGAVELREAIYRIFSAIAAGSSLQAADVDALNAALADALTHLQIFSEAEGFVWDWVGDEGALDRMLWPVARSAADLLTSEELNRVGECQGDGCGWLFMDMSRNRSRRWCDMGDCGNRAKARRYYLRTKESLV